MAINFTSFTSGNPWHDACHQFRTGLMTAAELRSVARYLFAGREQREALENVAQMQAVKAGWR